MAPIAGLDRLQSRRHLPVLGVAPSGRYGDTLNRSQVRRDPIHRCIWEPFPLQGIAESRQGDDVDRVIYDVFLVTNLAHESASVRPREFRWLDPAEVLPLRVRRSFEE